ncbi:hypothetical protein F53441_7851 [Fusarium austroafricanum]|uniref:Uncharacterized protein n=1 Tax=Fusarium austroafricanum TaxID=2364996 RepID=A0A8H4P5D1_9HYPO|nr:hypothetical protein F53441_7851 [Fusarium austroafricanum]
MAHHRTSHDSDEEIESYPMRDISPLQLNQLTDLLWMDPGINIAMPDKGWLLEQQARIATLDKSSCRSTKLWNRISAKIDSLACRLGADGVPTACLCSAHHNLDPKLIRRLMLLIIAETTERIQVLRAWRKRIAYPEAVVAWLDRIDAVTGLWIGRDAFNATFGYERVSPANLVVRSKCEACIMSVIGGRPQVLGDLRATLISRRDRQIDSGGKAPRLLRLVESWISHQHADGRRAIYTGSGEISQELDSLVAIINTMRQEHTRPGTSSRSPNRSDYPRRYSHGEDERRGREHHRPTSRQSFNNPSNNPGDRARLLSPRFSEKSVLTKDEQAWMDEDPDCQASLWMDCQMQQQGLTVDERRQLFENDLHPVFSDYAQSVIGMPMNGRAQRGTVPEQPRRTFTSTVKRQSFVPNPQRLESSIFSSPSAMPPPLSFSWEPTPPNSTFDDDTPRSEWVPVSVFSPPASVAGGSPTRHEPNKTNDGDLVSTTFADNRAHDEFCQKWGFKTSLGSEAGGSSSTSKPPAPRYQRDVDAQSVAAASSVYSSHPGFRRSQENLSSSPSRFFNDLLPAARNGGPSRSRSSRVSTRGPRGETIWEQLQEDRERLREQE